MHMYPQTTTRYIVMILLRFSAYIGHLQGGDLQSVTEDGFVNTFITLPSIFWHRVAWYVVTTMYFDVLPAVHLSIILVINQLNAQNLVL